MKSKIKRSHKKSSFLGLKRVQLVELGLGIIVIIGILVGSFLVRKPVHPNASATEEIVDVYFYPSTITVPSSTPTTLMMNARSNKVAFSRIQLNFDPAKVKLASEVSLSSPLKNTIKVSTMAEANSTGKLLIVVALATADKANPPTGVFVIGNLRFSPVDATANLATLVSINTANTQVVSITPTNLPLNTSNVSIMANVATPQPTSVVTPQPTSITTSTPPSCSQLASSSMSSTTLRVGKYVTVTCDFGRQNIDCIRPYYLDSTATAYTYPCTQTGWSGTKAIFRCIAPKTPGTYTNICGIIAGTSSKCTQGLCYSIKTSFNVRY